MFERFSWIRTKIDGGHKYMRNGGNNFPYSPRMRLGENILEFDSCRIFFEKFDICIVFIKKFCIEFQSNIEYFRLKLSGHCFAFMCDIGESFGSGNIGISTCLCYDLRCFRACILHDLTRNHFGIDF